MMSIPLPATVHIDFSLEVQTAFGGGKVRLEGPGDADGDGDPEFTVSWDLPGRHLDGEATVEIPISSLVHAAAPELLAIALSLAGVPGLDVLIDALRAFG